MKQLTFWFAALAFALLSGQMASAWAGVVVVGHANVRKLDLPTVREMLQILDESGAERADERAEVPQDIDGTGRGPEGEACGIPIALVPRRHAGRFVDRGLRREQAAQREQHRGQRRTLVAGRAVGQAHRVGQRITGGAVEQPRAQAGQRLAGSVSGACTTTPPSLFVSLFPSSASSSVDNPELYDESIPLIDKAT